MTADGDAIKKLPVDQMKHTEEEDVMKRPAFITLNSNIKTASYKTMESFVPSELIEIKES